MDRKEVKIKRILNWIEALENELSYKPDNDVIAEIQDEIEAYKRRIERIKEGKE